MPSASVGRKDPSRSALRLVSAAWRHCRTYTPLIHAPSLAMAHYGPILVANDKQSRSKDLRQLWSEVPSDEQRCFLLELPAELRLQIYDYIFQVKTIHIWIDWNVYRWRAYTPDGTIHLLRTCKTILREAAPVFYEKTTVHFSICDEFERPLSRYYRFSALKNLNATAFNHVSKVRLSLHTLTEPIFAQLLDHVHTWLTRLNFCANTRAVEVHFEFWSTISDEDLYWIYDMLCKMQFENAFEIGTRALGPWISLYEGETSKKCLESIRDDIVAKRQGGVLAIHDEEIGNLVGPRDLVIRSKSKVPRLSFMDSFLRDESGVLMMQMQPDFGAPQQFDHNAHTQGILRTFQIGSHPS